MLSTTATGENRQTYYTSSSQIGTNNGAVFLDAFTKRLSESTETATVSSANSMLSIEIHTKSEETLAFSLNSKNYINDSADPRADKYFDDPENIRNAISTEYSKLKDAGFTTAELTDSEITEMSKIFARISAFSQYNNQDYYGENNSGRYKLESGLVVDLMHQEVVTSEKYHTENADATPDNWTANNAISDLPGFEEFKNFGFSKIIELPEETTVDDNTSNNTDNADSTDNTDSSDSTDSTDSTDNTDSTDGTTGSNTDNTAEEESPYHIEDDAVIKALFKILTENKTGLEYGSQPEKDFKDLIIDFNTKMSEQESLADKKDYFDTAMPYIAELTTLLEEPTTVESIFKSIDVIFDAAFTNSNYSILDTGDNEINNELFSMRGNIDTYLDKIKALKTEMDVYNDENPLDAGSTEADPVWDAKLEKMRGLIDSFFAGYEPVPVEDFINSKLNELPDDDDATSKIGPEDGVQGELYTVISRNTTGIPLDSEAQEATRIAISKFEYTIYEMDRSGYSKEKIKEEFDSAMPYINKALELMNDTDAVVSNLNIINNAFKNVFLEKNGSVPVEYDENFYDTILEQRGGMDQAITSMKYYSDRQISAQQNNEPQSLQDSYSAAFDTAFTGFVKSTGAENYTAALNLYRQENAETS